MAKDNEILQAAKQICEEKKISLESVVETVEAALAVAYRKDFGEKNENVKVDFDITTGVARVFDIKTVVTDEKAELTEKLKEEKRAQEEAEELDKKPKQKKDKKESSKGATPAGGQGSASGGEVKPVKTVDESKSEDGEDKIERFNPKTEITLSDAKKIKKGATLEDEIKTEFFPPAAYGRMAAQTAKQVIIQRLREAERENIFKEFKQREGEIINGTIQRIEGRMVLIDLGQTTALLPPPEQVPRERYSPGQRFKFYVVGVNQTSKGPEIILSRSHPEMVAKLFSVEVPEIGNDSVEIKSIAREAGSRTKIAVFTNQRNIDPVGSCVGQRGSRVQTIISEVGGEKIDIIEWDEDSAKYITNALSPAKVLSVKLNDEEKTALVEVKEDQLSLAIGKAGQNVRLSAKLTGWKIDIVSDSGEKVVPGSEKKKEEKEEGTEETVEDKKEDTPKTPEEKDNPSGSKTGLKAGQGEKEDDVEVAEEKPDKEKEAPEQEETKEESQEKETK